MTYGHNCAKNGNGVAAYVYDLDPAFSTFTPQYEPFSSPGPSTIAFDKDGNRLAQAQIRRKPDIAAPDGVNTTFFPPGADQDYESFFGVPDGFPNFFGTSAAAPHAAAVAALVIQAAGGPSSIPPKSVADVLKTSSPPRDVDVFSLKREAPPATTRYRSQRKAKTPPWATAQGSHTDIPGHETSCSLEFTDPQPAEPRWSSISIDFRQLSARQQANSRFRYSDYCSPSRHRFLPTTSANHSGQQSCGFRVDRGYTRRRPSTIPGGGKILGPYWRRETQGGLLGSTTLTGTFLNICKPVGVLLFDGFGFIDAVDPR